jgi:cardiolipin synthase
MARHPKVSSVDETSAGAPGAADEAGVDRIWTVPNVITFARLLCLPIFLYLLFGQENRVGAAALLAMLGITDFLDGYIARRFNQVSTLGKVLDPVADRLLFVVGAGGILVDGSVPVWFAVVVLVREIVVSAAVIVLAGLGAKRIDVSWYGKAGTFFLMIAFPLFLASHSTIGWSEFAGFAAWCMAIPGLALSLYALVLYIPTAREALREGRHGDAGVPSVS